MNRPSNDRQARHVSDVLVPQSCMAVAGGSQPQDATVPMDCGSHESKETTGRQRT
jgi:hypothetical protein